MGKGIATIITVIAMCVVCFVGFSYVVGKNGTDGAAAGVVDAGAGFVNGNVAKQIGISNLVPSIGVGRDASGSNADGYAGNKNSTQNGGDNSGMWVK